MSSTNSPDSFHAVVEILQAFSCVYHGMFVTLILLSLDSYLLCSIFIFLSPFVSQVLSTSRAFTPAEDDYFAESAKKAYKSFITKAAASRNMTVEALHEVPFQLHKLCCKISSAYLVSTYI